MHLFQDLITQTHRVAPSEGLDQHLHAFQPLRYVKTEANMYFGTSITPVMPRTN